MNADSQLRPTMMMAWLSIDNLIKRITVTSVSQTTSNLPNPRYWYGLNPFTTLATGFSPDEKIIIWYQFLIGRGASGYQIAANPWQFSRHAMATANILY